MSFGVEHATTRSYDRLSWYNIDFHLRVQCKQRIPKPSVQPAKFEELRSISRIRIRFDHDSSIVEVAADHRA